MNKRTLLRWVCSIKITHQNHIQTETNIKHKPHSAKNKNTYRRTKSNEKLTICKDRKQNRWMRHLKQIFHCEIHNNIRYWPLFNSEMNVKYETPAMSVGSIYFFSLSTFHLYRMRLLKKIRTYTHIEMRTHVLNVI